MTFKSLTNCPNKTYDLQQEESFIYKVGIPRKMLLFVNKLQFYIYNTFILTGKT